MGLFSIREAGLRLSNRMSSFHLKTRQAMPPGQDISSYHVDPMSTIKAASKNIQGPIHNRGHSQDQGQLGYAAV